MINETLENLRKDIKNAKTIKAYLISKISFYDTNLYLEKQKIIKSKQLSEEETKHIIEMVNYYSDCIKVTTEILSELIENKIDKFED